MPVDPEAEVVEADDEEDVEPDGLGALAEAEAGGPEGGGIVMNIADDVVTGTEGRPGPAAERPRDLYCTIRIDISK